jgi:hypothetical protein
MRLGIINLPGPSVEAAAQQTMAGSKGRVGGGEGCTVANTVT